PEKIQVRRRLQAPDHAVWRQHVWKREDVRDDQKRGKEISTRDHENGPRAQNGELSVQEYRGDQIGHEHARRIDRDERVVRAQLDAAEHPNNEVEGGHQPQHNTESETFLPGTWREIREDEILVLGDAGGYVMHRRPFGPPLDESASWRRHCRPF